MIFTTGLILSACQAKPEVDERSRSAASLPAVASMKLVAPEQDDGGEPMPETPLPPAKPANRQLIRNATVRMRVSDFAASGRAIEQAARQTGGQIVNSNETKSDNSIENALTIRVPAARLDELLNRVLAESIFTDTKTSTVEDVTRRYVDVEARIRSKKAVEETYLNVLKQARNVADVLKVEEQLGQIREEREVQEAELRQLNNEVALSTVNLTYYQQTEAALRPEEPFYTQIGRNLADGFRLVGNVLVGAFYFLPIALIGAALVWGVGRWRRNRRNRV